LLTGSKKSIDRKSLVLIKLKIYEMMRKPFIASEACQANVSLEAINKALKFLKSPYTSNNFQNVR